MSALRMTFRTQKAKHKLGLNLQRRQNQKPLLKQRQLQENFPHNHVCPKQDNTRQSKRTMVRSISMMCQRSNAITSCLRKTSGFLPSGLLAATGSRADM